MEQLEQTRESEDKQSRLKLLIAKGKEQGYLTYHEVNDHLPDDIVDPEQIEDIINMINDMGIEVHELSSETVRSLGFSGDKGGLLVLNVPDDSPAAGKIRVFDFIDRLERKSVSSLEQFLEMIETLESEEGFLVRIQRQRDGNLDKQVVLLTPR